MMEKVSIIMAVYNCEKTISRAIDSVLNQTYTDWVMIICDDGSCDGTFGIMKSYEEKYPEKFVLIKNDKNRKLPYSLNQCLRYVKTDLIARMDGDDWCQPTRLEKQVKFLEEHPDIDLVGTGVTVSDGKSRIASIIKTTMPTKETMLYSNAFSHATIMTYKRVYDALGGYSLDPAVLRVEDVDLWCRFLAAGYKGYNLQEELYVILENINAVKRRTFKARLNSARTRCRGYHLMGYKGVVCYKPYFLIFRAFIPTGIYKILHKWKLKYSKKN